MSRTSFTKIRGGVRDETSFNILLGGKHQVCHVNWLNLPPFCLSSLFIWSFVLFFYFVSFLSGTSQLSGTTLPEYLMTHWWTLICLFELECVRICVRMHSYDLLTLCSFSDVSTATQMKDKTNFTSFHIIPRVCVNSQSFYLSTEKKRNKSSPKEREVENFTKFLQ